MERVEIDCTTGKEKRVPFTAEEVAIHEANAKAMAKIEADAKAQRDADLAAIRDKAKTDPAFAALARQLGIA